MEPLNNHSRSSEESHAHGASMDLDDYKPISQEKAINLVYFDPAKSKLAYD